MRAVDQKLKINLEWPNSYYCVCLCSVHNSNTRAESKGQCWPTCLSDGDSLSAYDHIFTDGTCILSIQALLHLQLTSF